jgi:SAM-dependent methyltransferase
MADNSQQQEETWEGFEPADFAVTPLSSRQIPFYPSVLLRRTNAYTHGHYPTGITIQSVDTTQMSLLDVCNYDYNSPEVDGSGQCIWMGALFFVHALAIALAAQQTRKEQTPDSATDAADCSSLWDHNDYFQNQRVAEMGCGTGTAGIALLKLSSSTYSSSQLLPTPLRHLTFLDNDPQALELCRKNCQDNEIEEYMYSVQRQTSWLETPHEETHGTFDTLLTTDVLYDLKIILPFFQTASRLLSQGQPTGDNSIKMDDSRKKHLILSHVPRWFLPPTADNDNAPAELPISRALALEGHIRKEALRCGFEVVKTIRPTHVLARHEQSQSEQQNDLDGGAKAEDQVLREELQEMDQAGAVLWVFEKKI